MGGISLWEVAAGGAHQNYPMLRTRDLSCKYIIIKGRFNSDTLVVVSLKWFSSVVRGRGRAEVRLGVSRQRR
jgi:hypothetical protein